MIKEMFTNFWQENYPNVLPIGHHLPWPYKDRWFRIHSLPQSKRCAESEEEFQIILYRQNTLINDLMGETEEILLLFGIYQDEIHDENYLKLADFNDYKKIETLKLHQIRPDEYEEKTYYHIFIKSEKWASGKQDSLLKAIANDELRVLFICPNKKCIIAPYDGGVDIIMPNEALRDSTKLKYKNWLSKREDGL